MADPAAGHWLDRLTGCGTGAQTRADIPGACETLRVKAIGIVGGTGPDSTAEYYRAFVALSRARPGTVMPRIIVDSIDGDHAAQLLQLVGAGRLEELAQEILREVHILATAGAELGMLASNTLHIAFDAVAAASPIPLVNIVDATGDAAAERGVRRPGLLATSFTVAADLYQTALRRRGIEVISPDVKDQERVHAIYVGELLEARFEPTSRDELLAIVARMREQHGIDGLILGGTELPLLLTDPSWRGLPFLDTGRLHVAAALSIAAA